MSNGGELQVPEGWKRATLGSIGSFSKGKGISKKDTSETGIPCIRYAEIYTIHDCIIKKFRSFIPHEYTGNTKRLNTNDIVFAGSGETVDDIGKSVAYLGQEEAYVGGDAVILSPKTDNNSAFLSYQLNDDISRVQLRRFGQGSSVIHIYSSELKGLEVSLPPLPEQKKIASILTSVDDVIEKTEAQISKLQDLKKGMMTELLTKGIGHTEFKDSPVGRIPVSWESVKLDIVAKRGSGHTPDKKKPTYWNGNVKWVSLTDSYRLDNVYIKDTNKKTTKDGIKNSSAVLHPTGTVILSRDAGIGKSAIITEEMAVSQHFMAWTCGEKLNNYFLYYLLQLWKQKFEAIAMGSTIKTIGLPYFKMLHIPLPELKEQMKISASLLNIDKLLFKKTDKLNHTKSLKKALMNDLLTGKKRVAIDN